MAGQNLPFTGSVILSYTLYSPEPQFLYLENEDTNTYLAGLF